MLLTEQNCSNVSIAFKFCFPEYTYYKMYYLDVSGKLVISSVLSHRSKNVKWWADQCSVQSLSHVQLFATPWTAARQASLSITNSWSLPKPVSIESVMPSNHLILCRPLLLLPSIFSSIRVFSNEPVLCIRWPKYWSFSFNISPSNEHPGLISFRMDRLDLLAVQGALKSLLQHHSLKAPILWPIKSMQSQRNAMPKNAQTTAQLHSSHMLVK